MFYIFYYTSFFYILQVISDICIKLLEFFIINVKYLIH